MPGGDDEKAARAKEIAKLKRLRSAKQGLLTREKSYFENKQAELNLAALQHLLASIDDIHRRFDEAEEQIIMIDPEFDNLQPDDEIPISAASKRFSEEYGSLRIQILSLIDAKRRREEAEKEESTPSKCRLPKLTLPHFDGNRTNWIDFVNEFESVTKGNDLTDIDKFRLLKSALAEGPRAVISYIEITEENYTIAWDALKKRYDNKGMMFRSHINSIFTLQKVSWGNAASFRSLLDKAQAHYRAMKQMGNFENIADNLLISSLLGKLDINCQREWEDYTDDDLASWDEFTSFLDKYTSTMEKMQQTKQLVHSSTKSH